MSSKLPGSTWVIIYRNYKGFVAPRRVTIEDFEVKSSKYHKKYPQLIMNVYDHGKKSHREYAAKDILRWFKAETK